MYIANITFIIEKEQRCCFSSWITKHCKGLRHDNKNLRLSTVVDLPGDPDFTTHAGSYSLQAEFSSQEEASLWIEKDMSSLANEFIDLFGQNSVVFPSVMQVMEI